MFVAIVTAMVATMMPLCIQYM